MEKGELQRRPHGLQAARPAIDKPPRAAQQRVQPIANILSATERRRRDNRLPAREPAVYTQSAATGQEQCATQRPFDGAVSRTEGDSRSDAATEGGVSVLRRSLAARREHMSIRPTRAMPRAKMLAACRTKAGCRTSCKGPLTRRMPGCLGDSGRQVAAADDLGGGGAVHDQSRKAGRQRFQGAAQSPES